MSTVDASQFSVDAYGALLAELVGQGYRVVNFGDVDPAARHLVLRHDVDVSLALAVELAEVEHALGYASHFFVLVTSEQYNPATQVSRKALRHIISLGHQVGLHFDAALGSSEENTETLETRAATEANYLSHLAGAAVSMLSFHRPAAKWINNPASLAGLPHSYQPRYFSEMGYCSDSKGGWWRGAPLEHDAVEAGGALQLLTHPIWWVGANRSPARRLADHLRHRQGELAGDLHANVFVPRETENS
jgi:hypothetical protein